MSAKSIIVSVLVAVIAYVTWVFTRKNWFLLPTLKPEDFQNDFPYTIKEVKTTYYKKGKLGEVLKEWHTEGGNTYIHLYRLEPGETFEFDLASMNATTKAKSRSKTCRWEESAICAPCFETKHIPYNVSDILLSGEAGSDYYASFAKLNEFEVVEKMWNSLNVPIDINKLILEQGFLSNFKEFVLTAPLHANGVTSSMGVQYAGKKTWVFLPPPNFRELGACGSVACYMTKSPKRPYELYLYTSQPGDVLFFAEGWGHVVYTHPGPNVLLNYRLVEPGNFFRQPHLFLPSLFYALYYRPSTKSARDPYDIPVSTAAFKKINALCDKQPSITPWDQTLMDLARAEAIKNK